MVYQLTSVDASSPRTRGKTFPPEGSVILPTTGGRSLPGGSVSPLLLGKVSAYLVREQC